MIYMPTKQESLKKVLEDMKRMGDVEASVIVSRQGLIMVSDVMENVPEDVLAAITATVLGSAESAAEELHVSEPDVVIVRSKDVKIIFMSAGPKAILGVMTSAELKLGLLLIEMEKAKEKITNLLG